jgi:hypothetical protein
MVSASGGRIGREGANPFIDNFSRGWLILLDIWRHLFNAATNINLMCCCGMELQL